MVALGLSSASPAARLGEQLRLGLSPIRSSTSPVWSISPGCSGRGRARDGRARRLRVGLAGSISSRRPGRARASGRSASGAGSGGNRRRRAGARRRPAGLLLAADLPRKTYLAMIARLIGPEIAPRGSPKNYPRKESCGLVARAGPEDRPALVSRRTLPVQSSSCYSNRSPELMRVERSSLSRRLSGSPLERSNVCIPDCSLRPHSAPPSLCPPLRQPPSTSRRTRWASACRTPSRPMAASSASTASTTISTGRRRDLGRRPVKLVRRPRLGRRERQRLVERPARPCLPALGPGAARPRHLRSRPDVVVGERLALLIIAAAASAALGAAAAFAFGGGRSAASSASSASRRCLAIW